MTTLRERIYQEFLQTPEAAQHHFCADMFQKYLTVKKEGVTVKDHLAQGLEAIGLAVCVDAGREDLWDRFCDDLTSITKDPRQ